MENVMSFWNDVWQWLGFGSDGAQDGHGLQHDCNCAINPVNGLPMVGGCGGVDVEGNPYGVDRHIWEDSPRDTDWPSNNWSSFDNGTGGSWDD
jgi:hypothetical protein